MSRNVVYSMHVSLDGYVEGPNRELDWADPDAEVHSFVNDQERSAGAYLYGRRLYELMAGYWPTAGDAPGAPAPEVDFARIWLAMPKLVFSSTLERVEWNSRLVAGDAAEEVARLKQEPGGELHVGGATLAASLLRARLVDEIRLYLFPTVLGAGAPFLPPLDRPFGLELADTRRFASGVVYLAYAVR
jgi:dihydrofolate reductase